MNTDAAHAGMGRPRAFDEGKALDAAMRVFWAKSYEGATMSDLTEAMGINRSSMYAAFGDKESLYKLALAKYREGPMTYIRRALEKPALREVLESLLRGTVDFLSTPGNPKGCLSVQGALACGTAAEPVKEATIDWRQQGEAAIRKRFRRAQTEGDWIGEVSAADLTRFVSSVMAGIGVQAASGASKSEMNSVVDIALRVLER
ncbi:MAG TPA: TetR/AcrR family transcriptional regulator [Candidatus Sulfotelmatobacter sp.]|jgi:AcrR family transcriptional regulator